MLDVNLRIQEILGLQKVETALAKLKGTAQIGAAAVGGVAAGGMAAGGIATAGKAQVVAAAANAVAINKLTIAQNKLTTSQGKAAIATKKVTTNLKTATKSAGTFGHSIQIAGRRYAAFLAATLIPFAAIGAIGKATASVIEFDTAILKMRQIMGQTEQQIAGMRNTILDLATATGTSASEIGRIGKIMAQAGFRGKQLTEALTTLSRVPLTPSFETIDAAVEGTIAALNQFNKEGLTTMKILDIITALSNKFAASAEDIAKGIARGGAAFEAIGGTFGEFAAMFTTVRQSTRESAETVGTFMKTISSRLADPKIVNFLEGKGIRIGEAIEAGDPIGAIKQIGLALQDITSIQDKVEIGIKLGGRRQISRLLALISNVDTLNDALATAGDSADEFSKIADVGLQGLQAQINIMVQEFNKLIQTLAEPLFVPIIRGVTTMGKAFVTFLDVVKPIVPALTAIIGLAAGFKLLALSISGAAKALAYMSAVGVGGGIPGLIGAFTGAGVAGGVAGATARERIKQRLAGGVGVTTTQAAVSGGIGARLAGGAKVAASPLGQLAIVAGLIFAADKLSESFEKTGESSGVLAGEFLKAVGVLLVATSLLSGKSITGAIGGLVAILGPFGAAAAAAIAAIGAMTYAANKAADIDMQKAVDAIVKKVSELKIEPIATGDLESLQKAVGILGIEAIRGIQEAAGEYENDWYDFFANASSRLKNLLTGEGLITIGDADAREIIDRIIGSNPELLNEILRSAIEQFGVTGLETGLEQLLAKTFGGNIEAAALLRQAMITELGGLEKIAKGIEQIQLEAKVNVLANAVEKASRDFEHLYVPVQLSHELGLLSDAVGNAARAIETNVTMFDQLSQVIGQDVGVAKPGVEFTKEAIEQIALTGKMGEFIDLSQFKELEGFTTDMARVGEALEDFMKSIIKSKAEADSLRALLIDPKIDPFDILNDYINKFIAEYPEKIPPEAVAAFQAAAANLGHQLKKMLVDQAGVLPSTEEVQKAFEGVLGKQQPFYEAAIDVFKVWMDAQAQQINLALSAEELLAGIDVGTAELGKTIVTSLQTALKNVGIDLKFPLFDQGLGNINDVMIDLAQNGDIVAQILDEYSDSYNRHAELNRKVAEAQQTGEGASLALLEASKNAAIEVLNLQVALSQLAKIAQQAPQALARQQEEQRKLPYAFDEEAAVRFAKELDRSTQQIGEFINRQRQFIEAQAAIDISQAFEEPADIFARALKESAEAVRAFTSALTTKDLEKGLSALQLKTTPEGRVYAERQPVPEARPIRQVETETKHLQTALFGGDISNVMETLLQAAAETAESKIISQIIRGEAVEAEANKELAQSFRDFRGFIYDIPKMIQESGLDPTEIARAAAEALQEQAAEPGIREVEYIGAIQRTMSDLTDSLKTLIERPEVARQPEQIIEQLTPVMQDYLQRLAPQPERVLEPEIMPRIFEDISTSATDIKTGGTDILTAGQRMLESTQQMQSIIDVQREALIGQQETAGGINGESTREAITETTVAVNALGERMDAITRAVEIQTQQEAELATVQQEQPVEVEGLEKNTEAIESNTEISSKTQEGMSTLNDGMSKVAGAMEEGVGIDIETMSNIKVDVTGVGAAAKEFTSEFEAVAARVAKAEINAVLQQLARTAGNSEVANTFESAIK